MQFKSLPENPAEEDKRYIFDPIRKKWLVLQPEELVRQLVNPLSSGGKAVQPQPPQPGKRV